MCSIPVLETTGKGRGAVSLETSQEDPLVPSQLTGAPAFLVTLSVFMASLAPPLSEVLLLDPPCHCDPILLSISTKWDSGELGVEGPL